MAALLIFLSPQGRSLIQSLDDSPQQAVTTAAVDGGMDLVPSQRAIALENLEGHLRFKCIEASCMKHHPSGPTLTAGGTTTREQQMLVSTFRQQTSLLSRRLGVSELDDDSCLSLVLWLQQWGLPIPIFDFPWCHVDEKTLINPTNQKFQLRNTYLDYKPPRPPRPCHPQDYTEILFPRLPLFKWNPGRYLYGEVTSFNKVVTITCICTGSDGSRFPLTLGFPANGILLYLKGLRFRILDPYLRCSLQGNPTLRVDSPTDFQILSPGSPVDLGNCKTRGDKTLATLGDAVLSPDTAVAPLAHYQAGLTLSEEGNLAAVLCSNAAQALLNMGPQHRAHAARYAAAATLLSWPCGSVANKAFLRYHKATAKGGATDQKATQFDEAFRALLALPEELVLPPTEAPDTKESAQTLKAQGNTAFGQEKFEVAFRCYVAGLMRLPLVGKALSNAALVFWRARMWQPLLAYASAASIFSSDEVFIAKNRRRCHIALANLGFHEQMAAALPADDNCYPSVAASCAIEQGKIDATAFWQPHSEPLAREFAHPSIALQHSPGKGRGVFAKEAIPQGTVLMVSEPMIWSVKTTDSSAMLSSFSATGIASYGIYKQSMLTNNDLNMLNCLLELVAVCPGWVISRIQRLCTSKHNEEKDLFDLRDAVCGSANLFLPSDCDPCDVLDMGLLVEATLQNRWGSGFYFHSSFFNHDDFPSTVMLLQKPSHTHVILAQRPLAAGEEITVTYSPLFSCCDSDALGKLNSQRNKWNIPPIENTSLFLRGQELVWNVGFHGPQHVQAAAREIRLFAEQCPSPLRQYFHSRLLLFLGRDAALLETDEMTFALDCVEREGCYLGNEGVQLLTQMVTTMWRPSSDRVSGRNADRCRHILSQLVLFGEKWDSSVAYKASQSFYAEHSK